MRPAIKAWWRDRPWQLSLLGGAPIACVAGAYAGPSPGLTQWLLLVGLYPPLEEYVFRGLVQPLIQRHWHHHWGPLSVANLLTSGLFTLAHVAGRGLNPLSLAVFFPSLLLGFFRERHRQLASPIALHVIFNAAFFGAAALFAAPH